MKTFEEADRLARTALDAGPVGQERPCDCIQLMPSWTAHTEAWVVNGCDCQNYDDAQHAQGWCTTENAVAKVRNLIQELTK